MLNVCRPIPRIEKMRRKRMADNKTTLGAHLFSEG